ncbi:hypothetical protein J1N35_044564 [Gossypium stocksii]|uniref:Uncharacterized protein n=1 Tax=Gossypium stocksii TaxID=47602 RepID=A0A9D3ZG30_9ROSI|nr:hypothetical protein J1N35_044564 [Gossypium stocksii]
MDKGKGILGELPHSKTLILSPIQDSGQAGLFSRSCAVESSGRVLKFDCYRFDGKISRDGGSSWNSSSRLKFSQSMPRLRQ